MVLVSEGLSRAHCGLSVPCLSSTKPPALGSPWGWYLQGTWPETHIWYIPLMRNKPVHNITNWDSLTHKGSPLFSNAWFSIMRRQDKIWETFPGCEREASHIVKVSLWLQRGSLLLIPQKGPRTVEKKTISACDKDSWLVNWEEDEGEPSPSAPSLTVFFTDRQTRKCALELSGTIPSRNPHNSSRNIYLEFAQGQWSSFQQTWTSIFTNCSCMKWVPWERTVSKNEEGGSASHPVIIIFLYFL